MTITFQPGRHPDADQLSAFIEQALPSHERDGVLAHLAVCADCRAVVALALPEETAVQPAPEPRRSSIFSGWMVFLPAAAAVAALSAFIFFVHRQGPAPQQQAQISPAPAAAAPRQLQPRPAAQSGAATPAAQTEIVTPAKPPASSRQVVTANAVIGSAGAIRPETIQPAANEPAVGQNAVTVDQSVQSVPAQNAVNSFAPAANNSVSSQNQSPDQANAGRSVYHGGAIGGAIQSNNTFQQAESNALNRQQQNGLQQAASQTVQVQAEAPTSVATESAGMSTVIAGGAGSGLSFRRQPLPSGLAILSSAARGPIMLAIDSHHSVFVSSDSGGHWQQVHAVWKGRAVRVEAAAPAMMVALRESGANVESFAAFPQGAMAAKKAGAILTGKVSDQSGAAISGATVTVTESGTRLSHSVTTDANGRYIAAGLDPGSYDLDAGGQGFMSSHLRNVAVTASKENVANFTLRVGAASQTVTVEASQASAELKAAPRPQTVPMEKARQAPAPLFEIVTDKGVHWASADGLTWQPK